MDTGIEQKYAHAYSGGDKKGKKYGWRQVQDQQRCEEKNKVREDKEIMWQYIRKVNKREMNQEMRQENGKEKGKIRYVNERGRKQIGDKMEEVIKRRRTEV